LRLNSIDRLDAPWSIARVVVDSSSSIGVRSLSF
jgi:hypothetical protein